MKTAAAYIRVSTDDQTELSPASQKEEILRYAKEHDYIVPDEFVFIEGGGIKGISGKKTKNRPEFQRMIATAKLKPRPFDAILVWKFSRFARNTDESTYYKSILRKKCGVDVISISEPIESGMYGRLVEMIIEWSDEFYSYNLAGEVRRGMTEKVKRGSFVSYAPIGYLMQNGNLVPDPNTAPAVQQIFSDFLAGKTISGIVRDTNANGVLTKFGNPLEHRSVIRILSNPVYRGMVVWSKNGKRRSQYYDENDENIVVSHGTHSPLVSDEVWHAVQDRLSENRIAYPKHAKESIADDYALRGLVRCHSCGGMMVRSGDGMQCNNYSKSRCKISHYVGMSKLKDIVTSALISDSMKREKDLRVEQRKTPNVSDFDKKINQEKKKLERVRTAYENGVYSLDEYRESKDKLLSEIEKLNQEKEQWDSRVKKTHSVPQLQKKILDLASILKDGAPAEQNRQLRKAISHIVFVRNSPTKDDLVEITYHF